ncbi:hypothetical protein NW767_009051 [Fusarium falciforme]|nr:hypothetical protein NW767_009051 [Fusarium falciforme]
MRNSCVKEGFDFASRFKIYSSLLLRKAVLTLPHGAFVLLSLGLHIINLISHFMGSGAVSKNGGVLSFFSFFDIYFTLLLFCLFWVRSFSFLVFDVDTPSVRLEERGVDDGGDLGLGVR